MSLPHQDKAARTAAARAPLARDAIALAFQEVGGVAALAEWIMAHDDNRKIFYTNLYPKLIAVQAEPEAEHDRIDEVRYTIVRP